MTNRCLVGLSVFAMRYHYEVINGAAVQGLPNSGTRLNGRLQGVRAHCLQHVRFETLGCIAPWLSAAGAELTTTKFYESTSLPEVDDLDLLVVLGGPMSVNDRHVYPWLADELQFVRAAISRDVAVLGICLGAQLIARALGARVYRNSEPEIGWFPVTGIGARRLEPSWAREGAETTVFHWHGETFDLPQGATPLARSAGCEHQAFRIGERVMGLQFHLETTRESMQEMVPACRADLVASRFVQTEREILAADDARFSRVNALMAETLSTITGLTVSD